jgi:hypothetical protein
MSSYRKLTRFAAAAALAFAIGAAVTPANAILNPNALTQNALTQNALAAQGSSLDELNGVAVEAVTAPRPQNTTPRIREALQAYCTVCGEEPDQHCCGEG